MNEVSAATGTAEMPAGQLALVFTDIESSTSLWEKLGDTMATALETHNAIIRHLSEVHRGYEVKTEGDSFFLYFEAAENALAFCLDAQQRLRDADWPDELLACPEAATSDDGLFRGLRVRMGIHCGNPIIKVDTTTGRIDLHGPVVNAAARISSVGHGGQVLISGKYAEWIGERAYQAEAVTDHGEHRLKGLEFPYRLIQVLPKSLEGRGFPELKTLREVLHNLPLKPTSFIGRETELDLLEAVFGQGHRLVTVTGAGGSGKSRITLRYGASCLEDYPGGVWFVPLMDVTTAEGIVEAVAGVIQIPLPPDDQAEHVGKALAARGRTLMVLDNFEQIVDHAAGTVGTWLSAAPEANFLVSSQIPLHLEHESVFPLEPLRYPRADGRVPVEEFEDFPALKLFVERAGSASPVFKATQENIGAIADICRQLDGIPLAIELAASRCNAMTPKQIAERMSKRFALLKGGTRGLAERKSTLFGAIKWSWDLLELHEQSCLVQTVVFNGGFTLEMAESVIDLDEFPEAPLVMDVIQSLKERNLLRSWVPDDTPDEIRFDHYESIKRFCESSDGATERIDAAIEGYRRYCFNLTAGPEAQVLSNRMDIMRRILANREDFIRAYHQTHALGDIKNTLMFLKTICGALDRTGYFLDSSSIIDTVWEHAQPGNPIEHRKVIIDSLAGISPFLKRNKEVFPLIEELLEDARQRGDRKETRHQLSKLAYCGTGLISQDRRHELWAEAYELAEQDDDTALMANMKLNLSHVENFRFEHEISESNAREALRLSRLSGSTHVEALAYGNIGEALFNQGRMFEAEVEFEKSIEMMKRVNYVGQIRTMIANLAWVRFHLRKFPEMEETLREYETYAKRDFRINDRLDYAEALRIEMHLIEGEPDAAEVILESKELGFDRPCARDGCRAVISIWRGDLVTAAEHASAAFQAVVDTLDDFDATYSTFKFMPHLAMVLPDRWNLGALDRINIDYAVSPIERLLYGTLMGHLALRRDNAEAVRRYADFAREAWGRCRFGEGHPYGVWLEGLEVSIAEYDLARDENRQPVLFRGFAPAALNPKMKEILMAGLNREERESMDADLAAAMLA